MYSANHPSLRISGVRSDGDSIWIQPESILVFARSREASSCGKLIPRLADIRDSYSRLKSIFHISYLWRVYWTCDVTQFSANYTRALFHVEKDWHRLNFDNNCSQFCNLIHINYAKVIIKLPSMSAVSRCLSNSVTRDPMFSWHSCDHTRDSAQTEEAGLTRRGPRSDQDTPRNSSQQQQQQT